MNPLNKSLHRRELEKHLKYLLPNLKGRILDIGSKNRRYDYLLSSYPIAIDIIPNENKKVSAGDVQNLSFIDGSFDSVICIEVLEYVKSTDQAVKEIYRVLSLGGQAVVSIPFMMRTHEDVGRYTEQHIQDMFAFFSKTSIIPIGNFYTVALDIFRGKIIDQPFLARLLLGILWLPFLCLLPIAKISRDRRYVSGYIILAIK
jgi:SAM-dependent methyltransferase